MKAKAQMKKTALYNPANAYEDGERYANKNSKRLCLSADTRIDVALIYAEAARAATIKQPGCTASYAKQAGRWKVKDYLKMKCKTEAQAAEVTNTELVAILKQQRYASPLTCAMHSEIIKRRENKKRGRRRAPKNIKGDT